LDELTPNTTNAQHIDTVNQNEQENK